MPKTVIKKLLEQRISESENLRFELHDFLKELLDKEPNNEREMKVPCSYEMCESISGSGEGYYYSLIFESPDINNDLMVIYQNDEGMSFDTPLLHLDTEDIINIFRAMTKEM